MSTCPRCRQSVDSQAIACPYCRTPLKAYGHPGIPLYRAEGETYLCETCIYHDDDTCNFPQRPYAEECTLYHEHSQPILPVRPPASRWRRTSISLRGNEGWLVLAGLLIVSLLIAVSNRS